MPLRPKTFCDIFNSLNSRRLVVMWHNVHSTTESQNDRGREARQTHSLTHTHARTYTETERQTDRQIDRQTEMAD